jgi:hypothetical protein
VTCKVVLLPFSLRARQIIIGAGEFYYKFNEKWENRAVNVFLSLWSFTSLILLSYKNLPKGNDLFVTARDLVGIA